MTHLRVVEAVASGEVAGPAEWAHRARIGAIIKLRRKRKGWTQEYLATQVGIKQGTLSRYESGDLWFGSASVMLGIFALLDMPLPWDEKACP